MINDEYQAIQYVLSISPNNRNSSMWQALIQYYNENKMYEAGLAICDSWLKQTLITNHERCYCYVKKAMFYELKNDYNSAIIELSWILIYKHNSYYVLQSHVEFAEKEIERLRSKMA